MERPDPRAEKLIALLYGELPEDEEREMRRQLLCDPTLRAEWDELSATRSLLDRWEVKEVAPRVIFVDRSRGMRREGGVRARVRAFLAAPAWGVAAAAICLGALALGQFRVERLRDGGVALRLGRLPNAPAAEPLPSGVEPAAGRSRSDGAGLPAAGAPPSRSTNLYVTREDLNAYSRAMGNAVLAFMDGYTRQQDAAVSQVLQTALAGIDDKRDQDYRDLRQRIDYVGTGLLEDQVRTRARVDYLWSRDLGRSQRIGAAPADTSGGEPHEEP